MSYYFFHRFPKQGENSNVCSANFVALHLQLSRTVHLSFYQCSFCSGSWLPGNLVYHRRHLLVLMTGDHRHWVLHGGSDGSCMSSIEQMLHGLIFPQFPICTSLQCFFFPTWTLSTGLQVVTNSFNYWASINAKKTSDYNTVMQIKKSTWAVRGDTHLCSWYEVSISLLTYSKMAVM